MATRPSDPARGLGWGTFFCGFVPGLLQWRTGQRGKAALAFGSCTVLFLIGWMLVRDRLFAWTLLGVETPPRGGSSLLRTLAQFGLPITLPELLNLPAHMLGSILAWDSAYDSERMWKLPRSGEYSGGYLTAGSGMLAAFWSAAGHFELRRRRDGGVTPPAPLANPALCAGLSWLLPGLGHARAGQRDKGLVMGGAVIVVFALGLLFSAGHAVDRANYAVWWIGQNLFGGGTLFAALVTGPLQQEMAPTHMDLGYVLCTVAGLMNLVVMVDAFTVAERTAFPLARAEVVA